VTGLRVLVVLVMVACAEEDAPRCRSDADCEGGRRCVPEAGVCLRMTTPLDVDAGPDAAEWDGPAADGPADAAPP
jgi:hypothetical protein